MSQQSDFAAKVHELVRQSQQLSPEARRQVLELLDEARKRILGELATLDPANFQAAQLRTLKLSIDSAFDNFRAEATRAVNGLQQRGYSFGQAAINEPLDAAGLPSFAGVSRGTLAIAQGYTADLISGLAKDSAAKVNAAIQRAFLGGQSLTDIIGQIGKALAGGDFTGLFSPIGERATTIAINEVLRVHSIAAQERLDQAADHLPGLKKRWRHVPAARMPRITHIEADGQVREVDEAFEVGGEELMYPRDPAGSPENTINCHCLTEPYFEPEALEPTEKQRGLLSDLGIEISVAPR